MRHSEKVNGKETGDRESIHFDLKYKEEIFLYSFKLDIIRRKCKEFPK